MKNIFKIIFSKKIFGILLFAFQLVLVALTINKIFEYAIYIYGIIFALTVVAVIHEINRDVDQGFKVTWVAIIGLVPVFGILLYLYVHLDVFQIKLKRIFSKNEDDFNQALMSVRKPNYFYPDVPEETGIFNYLENVSHTKAYKNCHVNYFPLGEDMFVSLLEDLKHAKKYIFLEFFIINESSQMWKEILEILIDKVKSGVDVRVIFDALGTLSANGVGLEKEILSHGIKCHAFSPVMPFLSTYHNNRNHRKIVAIDGNRAYFGGINIADEYINRISKHGQWKDTAIRITDEAASEVAFIFLKIWDLLDGKMSNYTDYAVFGSNGNDGYVVPFDDNPLDKENVVKNTLLYIINSAKSYVYISTPYLVLSDEILSALKFAAQRGVDVKIMLPHIPDKWYTFAIARTYYPELTETGVNIYEYIPGFVHSKFTVSDGKRAYIGSANYDYRSMFLHYECGAYLYNHSVIEDIKNDFLVNIQKSKQMTVEDYKELGVFYRLMGKILRLFGTLM